MDFPVVEPICGPEIDRLVTALLDVSDVMRRIIETTPAFAARGQTRALLARVAEHHNDEEIAYVRHFLAVCTIVLADGMGVLEHASEPQRPARGGP